MRTILFILSVVCLSRNQGGKNHSSELTAKSQTMNSNLIGSWNSDETDEATQKALGKVTMTFTEDGKLIYDIFEGGKQQRMNMVYKIQGDTIISDQPSHPQEQKTRYTIENGDKLILDFEGEKTIFKRSKQ